MNVFYVYALLDPRKSGKFTYGNIEFNHEPFYIGKGSGDRIQKHSRQSEIKREYNPYKNNKIRKIISSGLKPIELKIHENLSEDEAFSKEIDLINIIGRKDQNGPLANLYDGGYGSSKSEETRKKISDTKKRMYASGEIIHPMTGKKWSDEQRKKYMASRLSNPVRWSQDQKDRLKIVRCNKKNPSQTKKWLVIDPFGNEHIVYGLGEFCRNNNLCQGHLCDVANGKRNHHKGWKCNHHST